jgi:SAM-dependent methyltransferase
MKNLFSLGNLYVSDFIKKSDKPVHEKEPLNLVLDETIGAPKLDSVTDPSKMYGKYWYRSGINATMTNELKSIVESAINCIPIKNDDIFLDIACNDGTLLKFVPKNMIKVGIDPADDTYAAESKQIANLIIQDYFSAETYKKSKYGDKKAKIITVVAMFYDLDNPIKFLNDIVDILDDEGLLILQMSYTPLMLKQLAFDNICHEHIYYYSLTSIKNLLEKVNLKIVDCLLNDINGGSFRVYIRKNKSNDRNFKTAPYRDVANYRIQSLLTHEEKDGITTTKPYLEFYERIKALRDETVSFIKDQKSKGKTIWAYGASTKGNTLLQWFGLDNTLIDGIAERSPYKFGLKTVGTNIPIYSEDVLREKNPDYVLVLPWHFINEFCDREKNYLEKGGKFIVPCPKFEIIKNER